MRAEIGYNGWELEIKLPKLFKSILLVRIRVCVSMCV